MGKGSELAVKKVISKLVVKRIFEGLQTQPLETNTALLQDLSLLFYYKKNVLRMAILGPS